MSEAHQGRAAAAGIVPDSRNPLARSKATNDPTYMPRGYNRLSQARRRRDLIGIFLDGLGGQAAVSEFTLIAVRRAAELTVAAEMARYAVLNGAAKATDLDMLVKIEGEARRAVRALGLKADVKPIATTSSWSPMRERFAQQAAIDIEVVAAGGDE
jgi:hypothetical protein